MSETQLRMNIWVSKDKYAIKVSCIPPLPKSDEMRIRKAGYLGKVQDIPKGSTFQEEIRHTVEGILDIVDVSSGEDPQAYGIQECLVLISYYWDISKNEAEELERILKQETLDAADSLSYRIFLVARTRTMHNSLLPHVIVERQDLDLYWHYITYEGDFPQERGGVIRTPAVFEDQMGVLKRFIADKYKASISGSFGHKDFVKVLEERYSDELNSWLAQIRASKVLDISVTLIPHSKETCTIRLSKEILKGDQVSKRYDTFSQFRSQIDPKIENQWPINLKDSYKIISVNINNRKIEGFLEEMVGQKSLLESLSSIQILVKKVFHGAPVFYQKQKARNTFDTRVSPPQVKDIEGKSFVEAKVGEKKTEREPSFRNKPFWPLFALAVFCILSLFFGIPLIDQTPDPDLCDEREQRNQDWRNQHQRIDSQNLQEIIFSISNLSKIDLFQDCPEAYQVAKSRRDSCLLHAKSIFGQDPYLFESQFSNLIKVLKPSDSSFVKDLKNDWLEWVTTIQDSTKTQVVALNEQNCVQTESFTELRGQAEKRFQDGENDLHELDLARARMAFDDSRQICEKAQAACERKVPTPKPPKRVKVDSVTYLFTEAKSIAMRGKDSTNCKLQLQSVSLARRALDMEDNGSISHAEIIIFKDSLLNLIYSKCPN